ncbi:Transposon Ty3-G Gag-Pol poly [Brachionus plicatilis]|uniref:Transposon Ty3-G Gag-Pol poly n=1 Tax=Brachionus plicatilis TaxID=10195 RepID=A0A3M7RNV8_BRAPC|nr:Transposon Ty3-G Gag-Pol poly [Brachionus plicatilis]
MWFSVNCAKGDIQKSEEKRTISIQTTNESTPSREWSFKPTIFTLKLDIHMWWNRFKLFVKYNKIVEIDLQNCVATFLDDNCPSRFEFRVLKGQVDMFELEKQMVKMFGQQPASQTDAVAEFYNRKLLPGEDFGFCKKGHWGADCYLRKNQMNESSPKMREKFEQPTSQGNGKLCLHCGKPEQILSNQVINQIMFDKNIVGTLEMNSKPVCFLLDTGTVSTIVAKRIWDHCKTPDAALEPLGETLETCVGGPVKVIGIGKCSVKLISFESEVEIIVVDERLFTRVPDFEGDNSGTVEEPANIGTFGIKYRKGHENDNADALSRWLLEEENDVEVESTRDPRVVINNLVFQQTDFNEDQLEDDAIAELHNWIRKGARPDKCDKANSELFIYWCQFGRFKNFGRKVYRRYDKDESGKHYQYVVLVKDRTEVLKKVHNVPFSGHLGIDKTTDRIRHRFYSPKYLKDVAEYIQQCDQCALVQQTVPFDNMGHISSVTPDR